MKEDKPVKRHIKYDYNAEIHEQIDDPEREIKNPPLMFKKKHSFVKKLLLKAFGNKKRIIKRLDFDVYRYIKPHLSEQVKNIFDNEDNRLDGIHKEIVLDPDVDGRCQHDVLFVRCVWVADKNVQEACRKLAESLNRVEKNYGITDFFRKALAVRLIGGNYVVLSYVLLEEDPFEHEFDRDDEETKKHMKLHNLFTLKDIESDSAFYDNEEKAGWTGGAMKKKKEPYIKIEIRSKSGMLLSFSCKDYETYIDTMKKLGKSYIKEFFEGRDDRDREKI